MSKQTREIEEHYEVCDWCEREIKPIYDHSLSSLWPLVNPNVPEGGFLNEVKFLLANLGRQISNEPSFTVHSKCAQKMISWAMHQKTLGGPERLEQWGAVQPTNTQRKAKA